MNNKVISKQLMFYTIAGIAIIGGYLLDMFAIPIAGKISINQQKIATAGIIISSLGSLLAVLEIRKK